MAIYIHPVGAAMLILFSILMYILGKGIKSIREKSPERAGKMAALHYYAGILLFLGFVGAYG